MMKPLRFIHCADLHIDTPFKQVSDATPEFRELLYRSTYQSFTNIINLAISEKVDCVLVAGDVYDSADKSLRAQLKFREGLQQLSDAGIHTFVVHGNHDPLNGWSATLTWPENVHIFAADNASCMPLKSNGETIAQVCGVSFPRRDVLTNLAAKFERTESDVPHIALLHTNVGANPDHDPYAPCSIEDLSSKGMDYWALGHVHTAVVLRANDPAIVYSGCSQGRSLRETGAKGCYLVELEPGGNPSIRFVPTDMVRQHADDIDLSDLTNLDDVMSAVRTRCEDIAQGMDGRHCVVRLRLTGRSSLHGELSKGDTVGELLESTREYFEDSSPRIWLEKLQLNTAGVYDVESLRQGNDFIADIISVYDGWEANDGQILTDLREETEGVLSAWQGQKYLDSMTDNELLELVRESRNMILNEVVDLE